MISRFRKIDLLLVIPILAILPWFWVTLHLALNTNHSWLTIAAERLLAGGHMSTDFYDPNPPLSVLIYIPAVLASRWSGIPVYYMPSLFGLMGLILSTSASWILLSRFDNLAAFRRVIIITGFLMGATYLTLNESFGERDELVAFGLFPFLLAQLALTYKITLPRWLRWMVFALGAFTILIKPHYGLLPTIMLLHRAIWQRRLFSIMRDPDFLALAVAVLSYAAVLIIFFQDYLTIIAPDMKLYLDFITPYTPKFWFMIAGMIGVGAGCTYLLEVKSDDSRPAYYCFLAAFVCSCLYLLQMKGFYYHLIPTLVFGYAGFGMMVCGLLRKKIKNDNLAAFLTVVVMTAISVFYLPAQSKAVKHDEYRDLPLAKIAEDCAPNCSIFIFSEAMEMVHQVPVYTGVTIASRFPELWWLKPLLEKAKDKTPVGRAAQLKINRYEGLVTEDFKRYRPEYLAIVKTVKYNDLPPFSFREYFSRYPDFRAEFAHYRFVKVLHDNRGDYFRGTNNGMDHYMDYEIYKRID